MSDRAATWFMVLFLAACAATLGVLAFLVVTKAD
jgi:hypothetical protein